MGKGRLEAFSDGVLAILITIMVLELRPPQAPTLAALAPAAPKFLSYGLSFVFLAIYWNNHHHTLHAAKRVSGAVLWANTHLLFWLSLIPFVTSWMGESHFAPVPVAAYGVVLFLAACAYVVLSRALVSADGAGSMLARALGSDLKGRVSVALYALAVALALFTVVWAACLLYVVVAVIWLVPDRRIEKVLAEG